MNNLKLENAINTYKKQIANIGEPEAINERKEYYQSWTIEKIIKYITIKRVIIKNHPLFTYSSIRPITICTPAQNLFL